MAVDLSMPVLVVDDYNTMIRIIRNLLRQLGFEHIDDANDGSAALAKMRKRKYGLVISDWNMEPMTGYDLLQQVRADPELCGDAVHHGHGRIEDRERDRRQEGRRVELHRQAVQRADAQEQDRRGVPRRRRRRPARSLTTPTAASPPSASRRRRRTAASARALSGCSRPPSSSAWMPEVTNRQSTPNACAPLRSVRTESPIASTR